jgi:hypothetical protein
MLTKVNAAEAIANPSSSSGRIYLESGYQYVRGTFNNSISAIPPALWLLDQHR